MKTFFSQASKVNQLVDVNDSMKHALLADLEKTKKALEVAYCGFDNVTEPDLIDCYIYEVNSILKRYKFILNEISSLQPVTEPEPIVALYPESPVSALIG